MTAPRARFPRSRRLGGKGVFKTVMDARARVECGAFSVHAMPGAGASTRVGISIGRRCGTAARRNRIKRLLREAFRLTQAAHPAEPPAPYDIVVVVRPHDDMPLAEYQRLLVAAIGDLHAVWRRRAARRAAEPGKDGA